MFRFGLDAVTHRHQHHHGRGGVVEHHGKVQTLVVYTNAQMKTFYAVLTPIDALQTKTVCQNYKRVIPKEKITVFTYLLF